MFKINDSFIIIVLLGQGDVCVANKYIDMKVQYSTATLEMRYSLLLI